MDYRILGPLEVCQDGRTLDLPGDKQRALVAILLLHANKAVSADRLIDGLWGERPPPTANKALQVHVSRLRRALDTNGRSPADPSDVVLVTRGHGYLLRVEPGELDVDRFRTLVQDGRGALATGDADLAARLLADALALWRGPPLADFNYEAFAQAAIAELEELYLGQFPNAVRRASRLLQRDVCTAARRLLYIVTATRGRGRTAARASAADEPRRRGRGGTDRRVVRSGRVPAARRVRVGYASFEGTSIVIERVPSAYPAKTPSRDAGSDARIATGRNLPEATAGARTGPARC
jgi:DNA-binding SARP family transcriptional activator